MSQTVVPTTMDELVKEYDYYITGTILKLAHPPIEPEVVQELKQQVYHRLMEFDCLHRYDASKAKFTTYLYWVIRSVVVRNYERRLKEGVAVELPEVHETTTPRGVRSHSNGATAKRRLTATYIALVDESLERQQIALDWCDRFEQHLWEQAPDKGATVVFEGEVLRRSPALVFRLLRRGYLPAEAARLFGMSKSYVSDCLRYMRAEAPRFLASLRPPEAAASPKPPAIKDFGRVQWVTA